MGHYLWGLEHVQILNSRKLLVNVERLVVVIRARVNLLVFEAGWARSFVTLIVFVIKRIVIKGGLAVGLVSENSASRVGFLGLRAK